MERDMMGAHFDHKFGRDREFDQMVRDQERLIDR